MPRKLPSRRKPLSPAVFAKKAQAVAELLRALGNASRLKVLCKLAEQGEMTAGDLVEASGLSQSALSQHLARMRDEGLVTFRRESQTLWYRLADPRSERLLGTLYDLYCREDSDAD